MFKKRFDGTKTRLRQRHKTLFGRSWFHRWVQRRGLPTGSPLIENLEGRILMSAELPVGPLPLFAEPAELVVDTGETAKIVNGTPTSDFPEVGVVNGQCSGTLIGSRHVLTAGHCTVGVGESNGTFRVNGTTYQTTQQIEHPQMNLGQLGTDSANDISVMVLDSDVTDVEPAPISRDTPNVGDLLTLVGFGAGGTGNAGHDGSFGTKRVGTTPIDNVTESLIRWRFDNNAESNTAPGDSGGPAYVTVNNKLFVAGVTSGGSRFDAAIGDNSFDTRVDVYQDFIDSIVDTTAPPDPSVAVIVDNQDPTGFSTTGQWQESGSVDEFQGSSLFNLNVGATATWTPTLQANVYEVAVRWGAQRANGTSFPRDPAAEYTVVHNGQTDTFVIDQNQTSGQWVVLDTLAFDGSGQELVTLTSTTDGSSPANADAVRFTPVGQLPAGITVTPTSGLITTEDGGTDSFEVVLDRQPLEDVSISVVSDTPGEGSVSTTLLVFTPDNWDTPQTVDVTGVDDDVVDGDASYVIELGPAVSDDPDYDGLDPDDVMAVNSDNDEDDVVEVIVDNQDPTGFSTTGQWQESGSVDEFQGSSLFNLNVGATATWTPTLQANVYEVAVRWGAQRANGTSFPRDPAAEYTVVHNGQTDTFVIDQNQTSGQWVVLDTLAFDGSGQELVTLTSTTDGSSPANADAVRFTPVGQLPAGITVTPTSGLITTEDGGTDSFEVVLDRQPLEDVSISVVSDTPGEGSVSTTLLVFTPDNWDTPQTVDVTGVDDDVVDGDASYVIELGPAVSDDPDYDGLDPDDVMAVNSDNDEDDVVEVIVDNQDPTGFSTTGQWQESGSVDEFQGSSLFNLNVGATATWTPTLQANVYEVAVRWGAQRANGTSFPRDPAAEYTVVHNGQTDTFVIDQNQTSGQWVVLDTLAFDGSGQELVTLTSTTDGSSPANADAVRFTPVGQLPAGITVTPTSGLITTEDGGTDSFEVVLDRQPLEDVSISVVSDTPGEGSVSTTLLVFTPDNWDTPQTVDVTGVNDDVVDGDASYVIELGPAVSDDPDYDGLDPDDVLAVNSDNDDVPPAGDFDIEVRFTDSSFTAAQRAIFQEAADRWEEIIIGDLPDFNTDIGLVDDVVIDAIAAPIDGSGGILAFAGPDRLRPGSLLAARGSMTFDSADVGNQVANGSFVNTILHEMGHVLGLGTIWDNLGLIQGSGGSNPVFIGSTAQAEYGKLLGTGPTPVPIQINGGGHWRESVFDSELMTPSLDFGPNPLSRVTAGALADLGYQVNLDAADAFTLPNRSRSVGDIA